MKKEILSLFSIALICISAKGQIGINTQLPKATLDVVGKKETTSPDGVLIPRSTVSELAAKDAVYGTDQNGALIFVTSGTGASGKTSNITGAGLYYYDAPKAKWTLVGERSFNVVAEKTSDYSALPTDDFIKLNISQNSTPTLTLPVTGVPVGKKIYVSNRGMGTMLLSPLPSNTSSYQTIGGGVNGTLIYLGGSGSGSWEWVSGF
ncbi:hypothetical protein ODZ84_00385 [Chryseobacterium fluminis]|uniref:hypothetical protein n=1 Tax=Chryseobacterium fluminis TaxID=2983606 RepID=UPI002251E535|nr:hypothetical protein [Chryseobacterium sp. MMS21-Ot14]UZT98061.1 hypothetical protein ODZ84_00385 [Chryseobacterium sp. MMS21-Ot14]